ncbi:MAG: hypothetical protein Tp170SUR191951_37 [Prokaryotic dsDNA virus sp.]|nr:hypothetical protein [Pseudomonas sp.]MBS67336.1 hypothetical protein [Pseudomonas sp.]QDP55199.1 MAG: hypothetical protein Tp170SUR191951_37 [Prokaryotic dsDNA virus sp.]|tara:strand:- start:241 stop:528 length:288 start_codon:yes stop_codon:yes gene_type:complete
MNRPRTVPAVISAPTHSGQADCDVMTESAIHTISLVEGSFAAIVQSNPGTGKACISILDRDEIEEHIRLLRNAIEDAERINRGLPTIHAPDRGDR